MRQIEISHDGGTVTGIVEGEGDIGFLLAHGAGTDQRHPFMAGLRRRLAESGLTVMSFNYPYTERGSKRPDRTEKLLECHAAALATLSKDHDRVFAGGRSMGGRIATYLAAEGAAVAGVVLYAYPLHPMGKPERLRIAHLVDISVPMLFFQGTRDTLSRMELFETHIVSLPTATVDIIEGADHSFRGGGWTPEALLEHVAARTMSWIGDLSPGENDRIRS